MLGRPWICQSSSAWVWGFASAVCCYWQDGCRDGNKLAACWSVEFEITDSAQGRRGVLAQHHGAGGQRPPASRRPCLLCLSLCIAPVAASMVMACVFLCEAAALYCYQCCCKELWVTRARCAPADDAWLIDSPLGSELWAGKAGTPDSDPIIPIILAFLLKSSCQWYMSCL